MTSLIETIRKATWQMVQSGLRSRRIGLLMPGLLAGLLLLPGISDAQAFDLVVSTSSETSSSPPMESSGDSTRR